MVNIRRVSTGSGRGSLLPLRYLHISMPSALNKQALLLIAAGLLAAIVPLAGLGVVRGKSATTKPATAPDHDLLSWRADRARAISAPDGWLALIALDWLAPGKNAIGSDAASQIHLPAGTPGRLAILDVEDNQPRLLAPEGGFPANLAIDGKAAQEGPIQSDDTVPTMISSGSLSMIVLHRGNRFALRVKDSESPARTAFRGLHWYAPDPAWRITARWLPFAPPHTEKIPTAIGTTLDLPAPGLAEFTLHGKGMDGKTIQLEPVLESSGAKRLFFILRDATSHTTTYEPGRYLYAEFPDHGLDQPGTVILDFNRLQNPPCAYTPYATCPLPPFENRLAIAIPAGEQRYSW